MYLLALPAMLVIVRGKAGVEGTAKVATVNPMITMTASAPEVNLGIKEQKVSDVEIVETKADTIVARHDGQDRAMASIWTMVSALPRFPR